MHYDVKLDDGRQWKRHVDQMRKVGENILPNDQHCSTNSNSMQIDNESSVEKSITELNSADSQGEKEPTAASSNITLPNVSVPASDLGAPIVEQAVRRSSRISKPPNRLQYQ